MSISSCGILAAFSLALAFGPVGSASAIILVTDNNKDGSFINSDITYGNGTGQAFVTPLLFTSDFGNTKPAAQQVVGAGINYSYSFTGSGSSVVELDYTFTNVRKPGDLFPDVNGMRFMLDTTAFGSAALTTTDKASQNWPTPSPGDPDKRQIQDLNQGALNTILVSNNAVTDNAHNCALAGCTTDFGLEWDFAKLTPGESWTIRVSLVDNPNLVTGGRYLRADSVDVVGNSLIVGAPNLVPEPSSFLTLLTGLALLALSARPMRRHQPKL
jgi:hypothetical protein